MASSTVPAPRLRALGVAFLLVIAFVVALPRSAHAAPTPAHGLRGDYYTAVPGTYDQFGLLKSTVVDPNLDVGDLEPTLLSLTGQNDKVTVRWTGRIQVPQTGTYTFSMIGDNGFRLWVDGQPIIDHWVDDWDNPQTGTPISLTAGTYYDIKVEYFEDIGGSNLHLSWSAPSLAKQIVPNSALFLPDGFDYPGPLTSTVAADGRSATMTFGHALTKPPASVASHLHFSLNGTPDAVTAATVNTTTLRIRLKDPIPRQAGNTVRAVYDGAGGLATAGGMVVPAFNVYVMNRSTWQITTPWTGSADALPEYPRPQLTRTEWRNLNGQWEYQAGETMPTGHLSGTILVPYPPESLLSGVQRHDDSMWYRRTFTVPANWRIGGTQRLVLHFGAVDNAATVWLNGTQVATHTGGYTAFDVDLTGAITGHGPQVLLVRAVDQTETGTQNQPIGKQRANPSGIWYTSSSGIWQTVWLEPVADAHIDRLDLVPNLQNNTLQLTAVGSPGTVVATAWDGGRLVGAVTGAANTALALKVPHPKLWSPDHPFLYDLKVTLIAGHRPFDQVGSYFGMRSIAVGDLNGQPHILLNGGFTFHLGTLDQGFWPDGLYTAPTDGALRYDLQVEKSLGFNTVRKHIKVEPDRWYYWADKLGLIVWQDMPAMDPGRGSSTADRTEFESELHTMIDQHVSHPSIAMWVPFNEGWAEYDPARVTEQVKAWDPSRLVNTDSGQNCCASLPDPHAGDVYDNHNYPEPGKPAITDRRAIVDGEFGGLGLAVPGHMWFGSGFAYEMEPSSQTLTDRYVQLDQQVEACIRCGLSGSIYTQPTDVEGEINGLMTYDRRVLKVDAARVRTANLAVLAAAGTVTSPPPPPPGTPGPIGSWPLDTVSNGTTPDVSGHGHDGTLVNGPVVAAGAMQFNGAQQWVDTGASILDPTGNYSVSARVKLDNPGDGFQTAVSQDSAAGSSEFFLQYSGADHRFAFSAIGVRALAPTAPVAGQWYHLVGVRDVQRSRLLLYVDGVLAGSAPYCPGGPASGHTVIGRAQYQGNQVDFWAGAIDDVRVYDRALAPSEIS